MVSYLPYPVLVGTDILPSNGATVSLGVGCFLQMNAHKCNVYRQQQVDSDREPQSTITAVCAVDWVPINDSL